MKILLVCESFSSKLSGGKVVRYIHQILKSNGHEVRVFITNPFDAVDNLVDEQQDFITRMLSKASIIQRIHFLTKTELVPIEFSSLVNTFEPEVVHFASFDHTKPCNLYSFCKKRSIRIVLQPWTMHFFCAQGFGFKAGQQCTDCISNGFRVAIKTGCSSVLGSLRQIERNKLQLMAIDSADVVLSSNTDLDVILINYGISKKIIHRFPIAFDTSQIPKPAKLTTEDYFINYGQANEHKGTKFLIDLFSSMPEKKLRIYPMSDFSTRQIITPNIQIIRGVSWNNGLSEAIEKAVAVVQPSLWATSTEYALCEAMTMGKPVIAFSVGVHKDILVHEENAMLIDVGNIEKFKAAIYSLKNNGDLRERLSKSGRALISRINDPDLLHTQLLKAYSV